MSSLSAENCSPVWAVGFVCVCVVAVAAMYGQTTDEADKLKQVWSEYRSIKNISSDSKLCRTWALKLEAASNDPALSWQRRAGLLAEAGRLYKAAGEASEGSRVTERLYEGAVKENDAYHQWSALNSMIHTGKRLMKTQADLEKVIGLYDALQAVLSGPDLGKGKEYQQLLADSYYEYGRFLRRAADQIGKLDDDSRRSLYEKSAQQLEVFCDLGMFARESQASGLFALGESYAKSGRTMDAVSAFKKIVSLPRSTVAPMYAMWKAIEIEYPRREDRIKPMEKVLAELEMDKYGNPFKQQLVFEYLEAKKWDEAIELVSQIQETDEGDGVNSYNMFLLVTGLRRSGRLSEAKAVLGELMKKYPETGIAKNLATREARVIEMLMKDLLHEGDVALETGIDELVSYSPVPAQVESEFAPISTEPRDNSSLDNATAIGTDEKGNLRQQDAWWTSYKWAILGSVTVFIIAAAAFVIRRHSR